MIRMWKACDIDLQGKIHWHVYMSVQFGTLKQVHKLNFTQDVKFSNALMHPSQWIQS